MEYLIDTFGEPALMVGAGVLLLLGCILATAFVFGLRQKAPLAELGFAAVVKALREKPESSNAIVWRCLAVGRSPI